MAGDRREVVAFRVERSVDLKSTADRDGSTAASRFADLTAGLRSFELDCQAADPRDYPESVMSRLKKFGRRLRRELPTVAAGG